MSDPKPSPKARRDAEIAELRQQLAEAEQTIQALTAGQIDALITPDTATPLLLQQSQESLRQSESRLGERVKELTVLHSVARLLQDERKTLPELLQEIVALIPTGWKHAEIAAARILLDGQEFATPNYAPSSWTQHTERIVSHGERLLLEVSYLEELPAAQEGPFIAEERSLLDSLADMLVAHLERQEAEAALRRAHAELERRVEERTADLTVANESLQEDIAGRAAAEEALQKERDFANAVLDTAGTLVVVFDREGRIVRFNRACEKLTGYTLSEVAGRPFWDFLLLPEEAERVRAGFDALLSGQFPDTFENYWLDRGGGRHLIAWANTALVDAQGAVEHLVATGTDVTAAREAAVQLKISVEELQVADEELRQQNEELAAARQALEEERQRYRELFDFAPDGYLVTDLTGTVQEANRAAASLLGVKAQFVVGKPLRTYVAKGDRATFYERLRSLRENGSAVVRRWEMCMQPRGGEPYPAEVGVAPARDAQGRVAGLRWLLRDITERRRAGEEIQSLARFPSENPNPVLRLDREGTLLYANEASRSLLPIGEGSIGQLTPEPWRSLAKEAFAHLPTRTTDVESGGRVHSVVVVPLADAGYVNLYGRDVTEQRRAEEELRESEERFRSLYDSMTEGVALLELLYDSQGQATDYTVLDVNRAFEQITGLSRAQSLGQRVSSLSGLGQAPYIETYAQVVASGEPVSFETYFAPMGKHLRISAFSPAKGRFATVFEDITERKQAEELLERRVQERTSALAQANVDLQVEIQERKKAEEAVEKERQRFNDVLETLPAYVVLLTPDFHATFANSVFRQRFGESHGQRCYEFLFHRTSPCEVCETYSVLDTRAPHRWEWTGPDERDYDVYDFPFTDTDGSTLILEMGIDITERKQAERALKELNETLERRVAERTAELRETRDYLDSLLTYANAPIIVWSPDFRITRFNGAFERLTGLPAARAIGQTLDILFPEDRKEQAMGHIRRAATGERWEVVEIPIQHVDGTVRTVMWNSATLYAADGTTPVATIAQGQDITERKQVEQERERRAAELDATVASIADGVAIYGPQGEIIHMNDVARDLLGYSEADVGLPLPQRVATLHVRLDDGTPLPGVDAWPVARALRGELVQNVPLSWQSGRDDSPTSVLISAAPIRMPGGELLGAVATFTDIGELRAAQQQLQRVNLELAHQAERLATQNRELEQLQAELEAQKDLLDAVIENAPVGIVVADRRARIVLTNPSAERLYARPIPYGEDYESLSLLQLGRPDGTPYAPADLPLTRSALAGETFQGLDMAITWPDGQQRALLANTAPILDQRGQVTGAVGVYQDITQRRQMEETLERRNRDLRLLNRLSQELGTAIELPQLLAQMARAAQDVVSADGSVIWLWDPQQPGWLVCSAASYGGMDQCPADMRVRLGEGLAGWVAQHRQSLLVGCTHEDPRFCAAVDVPTDAHAGSLLAAPLQAHDELLGVLEVVGEEEDSFDAEGLVLTETLAAAAAIAIENIHLHEQAKQAAVLGERSRLARELHDAVSQTLFSASVIAESLPRLWERKPERVRQGLEQLRQLTRGALSEMRALLLELRPTALAEGKLPDLLRQLADAFASRIQGKVSVEIDSERTFPPNVQVSLYRMAQEALNNVSKHARATRVEVALHERGEQVELQVRDDGRGFDPAHVPPDRLGLGILRERAESIGATLDVSSQLGRGTEVRVLWPGRREDANV